MKAILEFNLPDDNAEFTMSTKANSYYLALWDLDQHLRSEIKYNDALSEDSYDTYVKVRDKLRDLMNENNISFD